MSDAADRSTQWAQGGPTAVREPIALGANATGAEVQRALVAAPEVEVVEHALAVDVSLDGDELSASFHLALARDLEPTA